jgi:hypothetical protein
MSRNSTTIAQFTLASSHSFLQVTLMKSYPNDWLNFLSRWWFAPMPATRLAAVRIIVGLFAVWYCGRRIDLYHDVARTDPALFAPIGITSWMGAPMPPEWFDWIVICMMGLITAFLFGWKYRWTAPALAIVSLWVITYRNSWSMIYHSENAMWLQILVLSLAPAADRWSLDAWLRRSRDGVHRLSSDSPGESGAYGWPLRLMAMGTAVTYFLAGVAKVAGESGWSWAMGESLRRQIAVDGLRKELFGSHAPELAYLLYDHLWLFTLLGVGTLVLELGAPLWVIHRAIGKLWAVQTWAMHVGIWLIMGIRFEYCLTGVIFACLFDVEKPVNKMCSVVNRLFAIFAARREREGAPMATSDA